MIRLNFIYLILNFFDFFQQKKIFNFLKKRIPNNSILFDVGAHHGETILNFKKNFSFNQIHSFEASKVNFEMLKNLYVERLFLSGIHLVEISQTKMH